ncbi:MAG TPA: chemotaxis signal transduction protein CheV [Piscirickettsiaceae bacterium]|nr:chemotaxis signal transduction protein CheV [Piscirickettsiaceae bacterium]HIQ40720.1 chemotaxis signal transduction protein CheV [Sulfurivirga caldicuralii]
MSSELLKSMDQSSRDAGMNRLELLLFRLNGPQLYGINIFKVREIIPTPNYSPVPKADPRIVGIGNIRGDQLILIDLARCVGLPPLKDKANTFTLITEFSHQQQGFIVEGVERIAYLFWENVTPPPPTLAHSPYLTAITRFENQIVELIDVEKVMAELTQEKVDLSDGLVHMVSQADFDPADYFVLAVDDSVVAQKHIRNVLSKLGVRFQIVQDGKLALDLLQKWAKDAEDGMADAVSKRVLMVISDVEMPEMDGYTLARAIRKDPRLKDLYVVLNSSLTGAVNEEFARKSGADKFFTKWDTDALAQLVFDQMAQQQNRPNEDAHQ